MIDKITSLTAEQEQLLAKRLGFWQKRATSVAPLQTEKVKAAVEDLYDFMGKKLPPIVFYDSPKDGPKYLKSSMLYGELDPIIKIMNIVCKWRTKGLVTPLFRRFASIPRWDIVATRHAAAHLWHPDPVNYPRISAMKLMAEVLGVGCIGDAAFNCLKKFLAVSREARLWYPQSRQVSIYHHPTLLKIENNQIHSANGPAIEFKDGFKVYAWRGIVVPDYVIEKRITIKTIHNEHNAEIRRAMIEKIGWDAFLNRSKATLVHEDVYGKLWEIPAERRDGWDGWVSSLPIRVVEVVNSTAEPDGSFKRYVIPVPVRMSRAKAAVAWTFGMTENEYEPIVET